MIFIYTLGGGLAVMAMLVTWAKLHLRHTRQRVDYRRIRQLERQQRVQPGTVTEADLLDQALRAYEGWGLVYLDGSYITVRKRGGLVAELGQPYATPAPGAGRAGRAGRARDPGGLNDARG